MGIATQRKLATRPNDHTTVRRMEKISLTLRDLVTLKFFAEGEDQQETGVYNETEHVPLRSLDRVPRRWWSTFLVLFLIVAGAGTGAWFVGMRPPGEWQSSRAWQVLHLPQMR